MIIDLDFEDQSSQDKEDDFLIRKQKANQGDTDAQYAVAKCYHKGLGVSQDLEKAFYYYKLSADQEHFQSLVFTAFCYEYGEGVNQSYVQAFHYYQLAADQGHIGAQASLGKLYAEGKGIEQSDEKAMHYYQLAAEQGSILALRYLADAYEKGLGIKLSQTKAVFYLQQRTNHLKARAATGNKNAHGILNQDLKKSLENSKNTYIENIRCIITNKIDMRKKEIINKFTQFKRILTIIFNRFFI